MRNLCYFLFSSLLITGIASAFISCGSDTIDEYRDVYENNPLPNYTVTIDFVHSPITNHPLAVKFMPTKGSAKIQFALGEESDLESFKSGEFDNLLYNEGDAEFTYKFDPIKSDKEYMIFARVIDDAGEKYPITTKSVLAFDTDHERFNVSRQWVSDVSASFYVNCDVLYHTIKYAYGKVEDREAFISGKLNSIVYIKEPYQYYYCNSFDLEPDTDYIFYCIGYNILNEETPLFEVEFKTDSSIGIPDVSFTYTNDVYSGDYTIVPNSLCGKAIFMVGEAGMYDNIIYSTYNFSGNILTGLNNWLYNSFNPTSVEVTTGRGATTTFITSRLALETPLEVYVAIYELDKETPYSVKRYNISTPSHDPNAGEAIVSVSINDITAKGATYTFTANEHTLGYLYETYTATYFEEQLAKINAGELNEYVFHEELYAYGFWQYCNNTIMPYQEAGASADTEYYIVVAPLNANGPQGWGPLVYQKYKTLAQ